MRTAAILAIALGMTGGALQAEWLQQSTQGIPDPRQIEPSHSRERFDLDVTACIGSKDPACGSNVLSLPRSGVSARTLAHKPSRVAVQAFNQGVRAWDKGQYDQALRYLTEAVRLDPDYLEARADLGILYAKTDRPEEALDQYEQALVLEPNLAGVHSNKATALVMLGRWEEAEQAARRALQLDSKSIDANYMLGIAMMAQGKITPETAIQPGESGEKASTGPCISCGSSGASCSQAEKVTIGQTEWPDNKRCNTSPTTHKCGPDSSIVTELASTWGKHR